MNKLDRQLKPGADSSPFTKDAESFIKAGFSEASAEAIVRIDTTMTRIRRAMVRREQAGQIIAELDPNLDLARLDVMIAVMHWHPEDDSDAAREVTVGAVAARLGIDPSRASRLVSDVIDLGYVRRAASQADSRRIVLEPTDKGLEFGARFRARKSSILSETLQDWTEEELVTFARLIERFSEVGKRTVEREGGCAV